MKNLMINLWAKDATKEEMSAAEAYVRTLSPGERGAFFAAGGWNLVTMTHHGPYLGNTR